MHEVCFAVVSDWRASLHNIRSSVVAVIVIGRGKCGVWLDAWLVKPSAHE